MKRLLNFLCIICFMTATAMPARADVSCRNLFDNTRFPRSDTLTQSYFPEFAPTTGYTIPRIELEAGVTYTLSLDIESSVVPFDLSVGCGKGNFAKDIMRKTNLQNGRISVTFTPTATDLNYGKYFAFRVPRYTERHNYSFSVSNVQLEKGSTATAYVPYNALCETCDGTVTNYESATGTVTQSGTPTPTNSIEPVFYKQGNMVLRAVGDVADSYDATTGKITRRVGVKVFDGTEDWIDYTQHRFTTPMPDTKGQDFQPVYCTHYNGIRHNNAPLVNESCSLFDASICTNCGGLGIKDDRYDGVSGFKSYLAAQYAAGTPVTVWYPLAEPVEETVASTTYCADPIKIATTKYTEDAFAGLMTTLSEAITKVTNIVDDTVQQATEIGNLATTKQDRPDTDCPAGRKCLLIMGADNKPHWYLIQE